MNNMAKHCKNLGMNLEEFREYKQGVENDAKNIYEKATKIRPQDTGMYFPVCELIEITGERDYFIINELKKLGMEFIENGEFYRI